MYFIIIQDNIVYQWISSENWNKTEITSFSEGISKLRLDLNKNALSVITTDGVTYVLKEISQFKWELTSMSNAEGNLEDINQNN